MLQFIFIFWITIYLETSNQQSLYYSAFTEDNLNGFDGNNKIIIDWYFIDIDPSTVISTCKEKNIIGGYTKFGYKQAAMKFLQLPPHYRVKIELTLYIIDSWNNNEYFQVYIDQDLVYNVEYFTEQGQSNFCGIDYFNDQIHEIKFEINHNGLSTNLYLSSTLDSNPWDESWGFRNFRLFIYQCPSGCLICSEDDQQSNCIIWVLFQSFYTEIDPNLFEVEGWNIENQQDKKKKKCKSIPVICGDNICGLDTIIFKNFYSLPFHTKMKIKFKYLKIDSWEINDQALLKVDGEIKWIAQLSQQNQYLYSLCGSNSPEVYVNVEITFLHSSTNALIQILNTLDESLSDESFGIRDIQIFIEQILCGDQIIQFTEDCDDGNLFPFDGCFNCKYSCIEGCSLCHKGICLNCFSGWIFQNHLFICSKITDLDQQQKFISSQTIGSELYYQSVIQCQKGFYLNQISNQCESICGDNFITNTEECDVQSQFCHQCKFQCSSNCLQCQFGICLVCQNDYLLQNNYCVQTQIKNRCQPQCNICIENTCYKCQSGQILILGQCQEICGNNNIAIYTLEECSCDFYCLECFIGVCYKCNKNYMLINNNCVEIPVTCGDLIIQENEECDDGNNIEFDGCFNCKYSCYIGCQDCKLGICQDLCQYGFYFINNTCSTICGDSILAGNEQCEDGNTNKYDGCYQCQYSCSQNCSDCLNGICLICNLGFLLINNNCMNICGDGILYSEEQCDDGNQQDGDGCSKLCEIESDWICKQGTDCTFVKYPILKTDYLTQKNQYQYVQITFTQPVQSYSHITYRDTLLLEILNLNETIFNIIIKDVKPAQFLIVSDVQYILQIQIHTNLNYQPILKVNLTEQLYSIDDAPLRNMIDYIQLNYPNYITEQQSNFAHAFQIISKVSVFSIYGSSILLIILGNSLSFWGILDALQQQSYLKFINVLYPQTLIIYFESSELISIQFLLNNLTKLNRMAKVLEFPYLESYEKFRFYEINADITEGLRIEIFLFATFSFVYLIILITIQIINNLEVNDKFLKFPKFIRFLQKHKRKIYFKFIRTNGSFFKSALLACSWDLIFMAFLEINTYHDLTVYRTFVRLSLALIIIITTLIFILSQVTGKLNWKKQSFHQFWREKKIFFIIIKKLLILLILVFFQYEQVLQTLILTLINLLYLIYVINFKPFDEQQEYLKSLIMETSLTLFTASTFLNWNLLSHYIQYNQRVIISWIQICLLVSVLILFMFFELYNAFVIIKENIKKLIANRSIPKKQDDDSSQKQNNQQIVEGTLQRVPIARVCFSCQIHQTV
ncbi:unnamed protein product [Paramecium sonneborni]|uniref:Uncharacterized protein n=1 Tax=Paramecium sonneborni TaxID=65129 RepID=A0A8S1RKT6_9CILI|nr:unnamed protein product [Paramecium sonneborni]